MTSIVISGSGLYTPPFAVSNEELVAAFNQYVDLYNEENASAIDAGQLPAKQHSSCEFIEKASGIKSRHLVSREGVLDPDIMQPLLAERPDDQPSIMVEMAVAAAEQARALVSANPPARVLVFSLLLSALAAAAAHLLLVAPVRAPSAPTSNPPARRPGARTRSRRRSCRSQ